MYKHIPDLAPEWMQKIKPFLDPDCLKQIDQQLMQVNGNIFPPREKIFYAYQLTPFEKVKVILLGQDPYHGVHEACGLSFAVDETIKTPPSLKNIMKELKADLNEELESTNLTSWAKQGVFLLNRTLTVEQDKPLSHKNFGWDCFVEATILALIKNHPKLVFVALGKESETFLKRFQNEFGKEHKLICFAHPSPLSAHRGFLGSKIFTKINEALLEMGLDAIQFGKKSK